MDLGKLAGGFLLGGKDAQVNAPPEQGEAPAYRAPFSKKISRGYGRQAKR